MGKIWMPGAGGADLDVTTATKDDVIAGKVIVDKDGNPLAGTLVDRSSVMYAVSVAQGTHNNAPAMFTRIPPGAYRQATGSGYPEIVAASSEVANKGGLTTAKMMVGQSAFGLSGTATSDANATANHLLSGRSMYVNGQKINGNIPIQNAETGGDQVWATNLRAWADGNLFFGVRNGYYLNGVNWIRRYDANFIAANIKKNVNMFGIVGQHEGYVPNPTDLYYRGNNMLGWVVNSGSVFEVGGIRHTSGFLTLTTGSQLNLSGYSRMNIELRYEGRQNTSGNRVRNIYMESKFGTPASTSGSSSLGETLSTTSATVADWNNYVLSMGFAAQPRIITPKIVIALGYEYDSESDGWTWNNNAPWMGWVYRVWME